MYTSLDTWYPASSGESITYSICCAVYRGVDEFVYMSSYRCVCDMIEVQIRGSLPRLI
jgi:hypothetical protein